MPAGHGPRRARIAFSDSAAKQLENIASEAGIHAVDRALVVISVDPDIGEAIPGDAVGPQLRQIFISSVAGLRGSEGQANYAASKAALVGLTRSLARELGPRGITVNAVAPGFIPTDMTKGLTQKRQDEIVADTPMHLGGDPNEVASAVQWLASPGAGFVTGAVIPVDGGLGMGH